MPLIEYPHIISYNDSHLADGCLHFMPLSSFYSSGVVQQNFDIQFLLLRAARRLWYR